MSFSKEDEIVLHERYLTKDEIEFILDAFKLPFNTLEIVLETANKQIRKIARDQLEYVKIYDGMSIKDFKEHLKKKFEYCLIEAGTPVGANTSDAIGQQATQALLNTFHSVGTAKSGGPDGIKENISISPNRKIVYSIVHMRNGMMKYGDVMRLKSDFIGLPISKLLLSPPESVFVNIKKELSSNPFLESLNKEQRKKIFKSDRLWWYSLINFEEVYNRADTGDNKRACIRLKFDVQKLYEFKLLTSQIAAFINKYKFQITIPKTACKNPNKRETADEFVHAVPSPTNIGIIDIFMKAFDDSKDHLLISLIHTDEFKNLMVSGIEGISNFYAVQTSVTRLIRDIEVTNRFDEEKGLKGTWLYLENNRFNGIPYFRVLNLLDNAGIKYQVPHFNNPNSYNDKMTELPFDFVSHKSVPDLRSKMKLRAYLFSSMTEHKHPTFFVGGDNGHINEFKCQIDHYDYKKIGKGFEVALYPFSQKNEIAGILSTRKFSSRASLNQYLDGIEQKLTLENFVKLFGLKDEASISYFKVANPSTKLVTFEINDEYNKYVNCHMFQFKFIDYQIDVNLDYVNSRYTTQSLDSTLFLHFGIPYNIANQGDISLPDCLRTFKTYDVERIDTPERRILLKTKMFFKDTYDYLNKPHRAVILEYYNCVDKDMYKVEKEDLLESILLKHGEEMKQSEKDSIISVNKLTPLDRFLQFIKDRNNEADNNYVYAETSGTNLGKLIVHPMLFGQKIICNHFYQVYEKLGLEGLRNTLNYDMINMINSSGYIAVEYMNFLSNVTTHNGINPMTSEGISCQKRDFLAMITYDNAPKYTHSASLLSEDQYTNSTSSCIALGKLFKAGTGYVTITIDRSKMNVSNKQEGVSEGFLKLTSDLKKVGGNILTDENEDPITIPKLVKAKFPQVQWILDNFVQRDVLFYIQQDIDKSKRTLFKYYSISKFTPDDNFDTILKKIEIGRYKRN